MRHPAKLRISMCALVGVVLAASLALIGCSGSSQGKAESQLDPKNPVQVQVWTYYNGTQQQAFESLVSEFNETYGKEIGVVVSNSNRGGVNDLAAAVTESAQGLVGSDPMPDAFLAYSDTAYVIDKLGKVADLGGYLTAEEKAEFVEPFLAEGDLNATGEVKVFPVSKSTETLQINLTDWNQFAAATGSTLDELSTMEGIVSVSQRYYEWTDAQTATPDDGKPFFGRDAMANYMITGARQQGNDLMTVENGTCTLTLDKQTVRRLWDNYYVPMVQGWFSAEGRFRSDAVRTGTLLAYVGSSSSVVYFPSEVTVDDATSYPIEFGALAAPVFEGGQACAAQQGAGFVVTESDDRREEACVEFLKWLTEDERNIEFAVSAGYMPVKADALNEQAVERVASGMENMPAHYLENLPATLETVEAGIYTNPPFENGVSLRAVLETSLAEQALTAQKAVDAAVAAGTSRSAAAAPYLTDNQFETWYAQFAQQLQASLAE